MGDFRLLSGENAVVVDASRMAGCFVSLVVPFSTSAGEFQRFVVLIGFSAGQNGVPMVVASHQELLSLLGSRWTFVLLRVVIVALQRDANRRNGPVGMGEDGTGGCGFLSSKRKLQGVPNFIPMVPVGQT